MACHPSPHSSTPRKEGQDLEGGMGKIPSMSADSERTISDHSWWNQAQDDVQEAESAMVLSSLADKEERSDSERTLEGDRFEQIAGHGYTDVLEVDSVSHAKRAVVKPKYIHVPLEPWLAKIDSGEGIWTTTKSLRSDGKQYDKYYFHKDYNYRFRSKSNVMEFHRRGTVKGKLIKKRSAGTTTDGHDYRHATKIQSTRATTSSNTSGSTGLTRGLIPQTRTKLPHGFL